MGFFLDRVRGRGVPPSHVHWHALVHTNTHICSLTHSNTFIRTDTVTTTHHKHTYFILSQTTHMHAHTDVYSQAHRFIHVHTHSHSHLYSRSHMHLHMHTGRDTEREREMGRGGRPWLASYHRLLPQARDRTKLDPKADPSKTQHPPHFVIRESKFSLRY